MDSLEPNAELAVAATYERTVQASLERVWENVLDWEHLPWLHARAFTSIELIDAGNWGWRAGLGGEAGAAASVIELLVDREAGRYVARTVEGVSGGGMGSEIWTSLESKGADLTRVRVEFRVAPMADDVLEAVGRVYVQLYTTLWDEDEEMMHERTERLHELEAAAPASVVDLGTVDELRARLPLDVTFAGRPHRVVELGGALVAHSSVCPHMLGPLYATDGDPTTLECPWHGYVFDARTGRSCDGRGLRLSPPPVVRVDEQTGRCRLGPA